MFEELDYRDLVLRLQSALAWLQSQTDIDRGSRYYKYLEVWETMARRSDLPNGGISDVVVKRTRQEFGESAFLGAIGEAFDLLQIHQAFDSHEISPNLLRIVTGGCFSEIFENKDKPVTSQSRNHLFELSVAAAFRRRGFHVKVGEEADGRFHFENHRVFIECKRLLSDTGFKSNLSKAAKQLVSRFESFGLPVNLAGQIPLGISMFSVGKILNPRLDFLTSPTRKAISITVNERLDQLWSRMQRFAESRSHENSIITGLQFRSPVILAGTFGVYRSWKFYAHHAEGHRLFPIMNAILNKLSPDSLRNRIT